jgi:hypothetical protein
VVDCPRLQYAIGRARFRKIERHETCTDDGGVDTSSCSWVDFDDPRARSAFPPSRILTAFHFVARIL